MINCNELNSPLTGCTLALGTFDGVHLGHIAVLKAAADEAERLGIPSRVLTFPELPGSTINTRTRVPRIMSNPLREKALAGCGINDICYYDLSGGGADCTPEEFAEKIIVGRLNAVHVFCGYNFRFGCGGKAGPRELEKLLEESGVGLTVIEPVMQDGEPVSSSRIRSLVSDGKVVEAAVLLSRPFETDYTVKKGKMLGRRLGFPTVNSSFPFGGLIPGFGVYATRSLVDGTWYDSVTNVGTGPTVGGNEVTQETYILGIDQDLYGRTVNIRYIDKIRNEKFYESLEDLKTQIKNDVSEAERILSHGTQKQ